MSADEIPERTGKDLDRLKAAMRIPSRPLEDQESKNVGPRVQRTPSGDLPQHPLGRVRQAILKSLDRHKMTRYKLWKKARTYCDSLPVAAVYEYLRGTRNIGSEYVEALLLAAKLKVVERRKSTVKKRTASYRDMPPRSKR
jgi:hypothetical protein